MVPINERAKVPSEILRHLATLVENRLCNVISDNTSYQRCFTNGSGMVRADGPWSISLTVFGIADKNRGTTLPLARRAGYNGDREIILLDHHRLWLGSGRTTDEI